jgi:hypothetical protein
MTSQECLRETEVPPSPVPSYEVLELQEGRAMPNIYATVEDGEAF